MAARRAATVALVSGLLLTAAVSVAAPRRKPGHATATAKPATAKAKQPPKSEDHSSGGPVKSEQGFGTLSHGSVQATGKRDAILSVSRFGRYAVTANSAQGTAVQLVSRMIGPGEVQGDAGTANGRIDAFLDRGDYKIVVFPREGDRARDAQDPRFQGDQRSDASDARGDEARRRRSRRSPADLLVARSEGTPRRRAR